MLLGSQYTGMAFSNVPCATVHALAYPIGKEECRSLWVVSMRLGLF
jgi:alcohol dehydrogenase class IV